MFDVKDLLTARDGVAKSRHRIVTSVRQMPSDSSSLAVCAEELRVLDRWIQQAADRVADEIIRADDPRAAIMAAEWGGLRGWDAFWEVARYAQPRSGLALPQFLAAKGFSPWETEREAHWDRPCAAFIG